MRINHNISALNTYNKMTVNQNAATKNMEKLSSGQRINRAGDDAAGLAISEKMRGQIRGLEQAATNAQDGISLIQTAEGALNETHAILQRMRELSVQAANDTNTAEDRSQLQNEVDQLSQEVTRISKDTTFNNSNLLDGSFDGKFHIGANSGQNLSVSIGSMDATELGIVGIDGTEAKASGIKVVNNTLTEVSLTIETNGNNDTQTKAEVDKDGNFKITIGKDNNGTPLNVTTEDAVKLLNETLKNAAPDAHGLKFEVETAGNISDTGKQIAAAGTINEEKGINISTQEDASHSISVIDEAINSVSAERAKMGAVQNRLEHTINNLSTSAENLTAAESRIRDVDMAKEMMEMTKNNILQQAAQSMLAQANQTPQNVLQLLR